MRCFLFLIKLMKSQLRFIRYIRYISLYGQQTRQNSTVFLYTFQLEIRLTVKRFVLKEAVMSSPIRRLSRRFGWVSRPFSNILLNLAIY